MHNNEDHDYSQAAFQGGSGHLMSQRDELDFLKAVSNSSL